MSKEINLLPGKKNTNKYQEKLLKAVQLISGVFLVATILCSILFFIFNIDPTLSRILQQKNNTLTNLSFTHGKVAKYLLIKDRIGTITTIIHNRSSLDDIIASLQQQVPPDVAIDSMSIDDKTLTMSLSATSLSSLDTFITNATQMLQNKTVLKTITLDSITMDPSVGKYILSVKSNLL